MRKDDVTFHAEMWRTARPAVNVKVWARVDSEEAIGAARREDSSLDPRFEAWYREGLERESFAESYWSFAIETGWEYLQSLAEDVFGPGVNVYSEGRSGGWAVVDGLPDFESWDAVMLGRWARFAKRARAAADAIPENMSILASINGFETFLAEDSKRMTGPSFEAVA